MNRQEIERLDDQGMAAWDSHDVDGFVTLFANEFVWVDDTQAEPIRTEDAARQYLANWYTAFPDMRVRTTNRVVGDDAVAVEVEWTGTNNGPLSVGGQDVPPTGRTVAGRGCYFARAENGKITEFHTHPDAVGLMAQLGLMPASA